MRTWLEERVEDVRERLTADDEGSLWMLLLEDPSGEPVIASAVDGAMAGMDSQLTRNLAMIITEVGAKAVLLAIPRRTGRPHPVDRQLWSDLRHLVGSSTELIDLVVVGDAAYWSAQGAPG